MEHAASQLLRAIRGRRSQVAFARRLGYRANPITDWETGRRFPTAAETLRACRRVGIDLGAAFEQFHRPAAGALGDGDDDGVTRWLNEIRGNTPINDIAQRIDRSRYAVGRWLRGGARPRIPDFLRLVDAMTGRVPALVAALVPIEQVPALLARHTADVAARRLAIDEPWTELILRALETEAFQSGPPKPTGWLSDKLGIDLQTERRCLEQLVVAGILERSRGGYSVIGQLSVDTSRLNQLKAHWSQAAKERLLSGPKSGDLFAHNVISVSTADLARIRTLQREYYRQLRSLVAASEPCETVALINLQIVEWPLE